jgi:hypothetical protein
MKILKEVTQWKVPYRQPNHVYLMDGDRALAYVRWGQGEPEYFATPTRIDRRGRKFIEVNNDWGFKVTVRAPAPEPGQSWTVTGSRGDTYTVKLDAGRWSCTCPGHSFRGRCRHVNEQQEKENACQIGA